MNVRIIDPGKSFSARRRQWGQSPDGDEMGELDDLPARASDDRLDLLIDLRVLQDRLLTEGTGRQLVPESLQAFWTERGDFVRSSITTLEKIAGDLGLELPLPRRTDFDAGFADLSGKPAGDPLSAANRLIGAVLFFNALGLSVVAAFLREEDRTILKNGLLPILAEDSRFEGRLRGYLDVQGEATAVLADEWLSLAASVGSGMPARLWSFDLLRMGIRRLLGRGFFPVE
jgi:hypothetical protein